MSQSNTINKLIKHIQSHYDLEGKPISFREYLEFFFSQPTPQCRGAAQYIRDTFDFFGSETINIPSGKVRRFKLFDAEFANRIGRVAGQEEVQEAIYKLLNNFVREGRTNRLILLHGPNGSAKTSIIRGIIQAMEHYSTTQEGALFRFRWLFPSEKIIHSHIGFADGVQTSPQDLNSFSQLPGENLNAVLECELKDHPLLLIPTEERQALFEKLREEGAIPKGHRIPDYLYRGNLCAKCRQIYDAMLAAYGGNNEKVLRHVQVQRLHISFRYHRATATVEPQMHVDAAEQQLTASQGLASLPPAISHLTLYEPRGPLVDANRGLLEYNDLLKRPIDTFKYLLSTCETGQVTLDRSSLFLDTVFLGSTNELLLDSFKTYADFASFKGRLELIRVPYLRLVTNEVEIYRDQIPARSLERHLAPHTMKLAALWAVLTRLIRTDTNPFSGELVNVLRELSPIDKALMYDRGQLPAGLSSTLAKELKNILAEIYKQPGRQLYEGRIGASPREIRMLLMNAAQRNDNTCVTPLCLMDEIRSLIADRTLFEFLKQEPDGLYMNQDKLIEMVESTYLDILDNEAVEALGMVSEASYTVLFNRYIQHVTHWMKNEKLLDPITGNYIPPDKEFMKQVESIIRSKEEDQDVFRKNLISRIGAFALDADRTGKNESSIDFSEVFPLFFEKLKDDYFKKRQVTVQKNFIMFLNFMDGKQMESNEMQKMQAMQETLETRFGYCKRCATSAMAFLLKKRYSH